MSKPQDGFVSRFLNRPISRSLTGFLLNFPIRPTTWTFSILILPLLACLFLARGGYFRIVIGTTLFQIHSILDGCDGEIARAKNLESKFGERLDSLCDAIASVLFVVVLGLGLHRVSEGMVCAALIALNEWLPQMESRALPVSIGLDGSFYQKHHRMIVYTGMLRLGEKLVWWIFQLTKRDVAVFAFLLLAVTGWPEWILHLWVVVAAASLLLHTIATMGVRHGEEVAEAPRT